MKISHIWINDGIKTAWATPSRREAQAWRKAGKGDILDYCDCPRGWEFSDDDDTSDDGGNPGRYLIRIGG